MVHEKSVAELRAMVKSARKEKMKAPSKMKKHELLAELGEVVEVPVVKVDVPVAKKKEAAVQTESAAPVKSIAKAETGAIPKAVVPPAKKMGKGKVTESVVAEVKQETSKMPVKKLIAGSQIARDRMAAIRAMRKSKTESVE